MCFALHFPQNRSDAHFFLLVQMHHTILEQFTPLEKVVRADLLIANKSDTWTY
jgi:hypothetical protein